MALLHMDGMSYKRSSFTRASSLVPSAMTHAFPIISSLVYNMNQQIECIQLQRLQGLLVGWFPGQWCEKGCVQDVLVWAAS